ncbi:hypothetical protein F3K02_09220 [Hydrogenophaga sp. D2P1]|uniref:DUF551 domain-containing protein n=1 Tax=Hydrogenophaga aromaticivorans TaxID=2610898 RepID=A0A7Y8GV43_9BURK|nr:hypothetical protein [Hydrogenophaga aromaticivorans]NWF45426.1 hypothetical protein [Hydrogenophaga aromaticivorans]
MIDNLKEREEFEAWYGDQGKWPAAVERIGDGYKLAAAQSAWVTWQARAAIEANTPAVPDARIVECARRLIEHADFALGGCLSASSKVRDIPSNACSQVKARHLAALRDALAAAPQPQQVAQPVQASQYGSPELQSLILEKLAQPVQAREWHPIETAPDDMTEPVMVFWIDSDGAPMREFDYKEDGCWMGWHEHAEHVEIIGGHGVSYTPPYTHWMPLPPPPTNQHKDNQ